ncbi:MAG TPA: mechanosensitive ion channel family protein [Thermoanaerobaculia bacterium]|nr:mechanosensitive ion channel family protein [Thermoanaerobaculia bacterium]
MKRRSRLFFSLILGAALLALYWFLGENRSYLGATAADQKRILNITLFVACIPLIVFAVRLVDLLAFDFFISRRKHVQAPLLLRELVQALLYMVLLAWALWSIFEYRVTALLATGTVVAAILGLALQETLGNLFSGMALHLDETFSPGDVIRAGDILGVVEAVRWRGTRLRTFNNNVMIVPNSVLARASVEVFPRNNLKARVLQIGIDYHVPPATVINVLVQAAANVEGVSHDIPAFARVGNFGDSAVIYEIKYHMHDYSQRDRIDADIRKAVWYALRRNAISIPFPIRTLHRYAPPETHHQPSTGEILHRLARVDVLSPLSAEALDVIAHAAQVHVFSRGETIISIGAAGNSMFIVHEGAVSVRVDDAEVARLQPGDFFGEMALLTGERRTADIIALSDVVAVEITKEAIEPVLRDHPDLDAAISTKVAQRRGSLDSLRADAPAEEQGNILSRIRAYFRL